MIHHVCPFLCVAAVREIDWQAGGLARTAANQILWSFALRRRDAKIRFGGLCAEVKQDREEFISSESCEEFHCSTVCVRVCVCGRERDIITVGHFKQASLN